MPREGKGQPMFYRNVGKRAFDLCASLLALILLGRMAGSFAEG